MEAQRMVSIAQVIVLSIGIIMMAVTFARYFLRKQKLADLIIWAIVWAFFIVAVVLFNKIRFIGEVVFNLEIMDFFLFFAILIIFILMFMMHSNIKSTQQKLNKTIEYIAVQEGKKKTRKILQEGDAK